MGKRQHAHMGKSKQQHALMVDVDQDRLSTEETTTTTSRTDHQLRKKLPRCRTSPWASTLITTSTPNSIVNMISKAYNAWR